MQCGEFGDICLHAIGDVELVTSDGSQSLQRNTILLGFGRHGIQRLRRKAKEDSGRRFAKEATSHRSVASRQLDCSSEARADAGLGQRHGESTIADIMSATG